MSVPIGGRAARVPEIAATLLLVDRATVRVGMIQLVRMSTLIGAGGLGVCLLINRPVAATAGFVILSIGVAAVNPSIYTLAGSRPDLTTSESVSVVEVAQMPTAAIGWTIPSGDPGRCARRGTAAAPSRLVDDGDDRAVVDVLE
jgi:hypothetical protein